MKYHSIITSALTSLCLLTSNSSLATQSSKTSPTELARWFEIEVILFKHLSSSSVKNSENIEQFSASDLRAKKRRALDLLAPYLQPDIASLKQLLPSCEQPHTSLPYNITPSILWADKLDNENNDADSNNSNSSDSDTISSQVVDNKESNSSNTMSVTVLSPAPNEKVKDDVAIAAQQGLKKEGLSKVSKQVHSSSAELPTDLPVYNQYPISSSKQLCVIPAEFFQQQLTAEQLEQFSLDGFPVDKITKTIHGLEQWQDDENGEITWASDSPYLISQDSLRLKSIANRIKRSRNYAPLLHLGWRQIGESKRKAKAMKLYAGDHLELGYQQAIAAKALEQKTLAIQAILEQRQKNEVATDSTSNNNGMIISQSHTSDLAVDNAEATNELSITEQLRLLEKKQQLDTIFQQFSLFSNQSERQESNTNALSQNEEILLNEKNVQGIVAQLSADITAQESQLNLKNTIDKQGEITAPLQPWSLDGLFKLHLDHYLYINTELNIVESSIKLSNKDNKISNQNKIISFKQDRRVISGEIHYFDHPHLGMIVQIRRFDPTKPANEAVSQAKK
jgi:hypothetical protein